MRRCKYCGTEVLSQHGNCPSCGGNMFIYYPVSHKKSSKSKSFEVAVLSVAISALFVLCLALVDITSSSKDRTVTVSTVAVSSPVHTMDITYNRCVLTSSEALSIALSDAGLEKKDLKDLSVKYKSKDDEYYYKVSFKYCGHKHTYFISSITGEIIKVKHEKD